MRRATREFPTEVVLSLTTGFLLKHGGFGEMAELAAHVLGHPVWTHEFADAELIARMREAVFAQHPALRDVETFVRPERDLATYVDGYVARAVEKFGARLSVAPGSEERTEDPLTSAERIRASARRRHADG